MRVRGCECEYRVALSDTFAGTRTCMSSIRIRLDPLVTRIRAHLGKPLAQVIVFGSFAAGTEGDASDIDLLLLIDPGDERWSPARNVEARKQLELAVPSHEGHRLDMWVRTLQQYVDARHVIGGIEEYAFTTGIPLLDASDALLSPRAARHELRYQYIQEWLAEGAHLAAYAAAGAPGSGASADVARASHYSRRSIQKSIGAVFVWRQLSPPPKRAALPEWLNRLGETDPVLAEALASLVGGRAPAPTLAVHVQQSVARYLAFDPRLRHVRAPSPSSNDAAMTRPA